MALMMAQMLLNYLPDLSGGSCDGGDDYVAASFFHRYGAVDDTCAPYTGGDYGWGDECCGTGARQDVAWVRDHLCHTCSWTGTCGWQSKYQLYRASAYGRVSGEKDMMAEIRLRGPIACSIDSAPVSFDNYTGGVITGPIALNNDTDHVIVLAGFGTDDAHGPYWIGRNSYGTSWGENGWFRIARGRNVLAIESGGCSWAEPHPEDVERLVRISSSSIDMTVVV
eukprot:gnl/TRDRNA2_/TRDRNA2_163743_c0_seq1.p1 gnl/TRDRNA2_/TRDRNA2_163743_c0~~gnl/TRDRNA2_/TRDRNA2_163743_c0_seq1.p1  ORF type:complete len:224 (-),score=26.07 gnl/TRDRNA2_/TRDRNA2_163743_c0_seq1:19-690(-)